MITFTFSLNKRSKGDIEGIDASAKDTRTVPVQAVSYSAAIKLLRTEWPRKTWALDDTVIG